MWLNSMQREEPYLGLTCNEQHVKACDSSEALHRCCMGYKLIDLNKDNTDKNRGIPLEKYLDVL